MGLRWEVLIFVRLVQKIFAQLEETSVRIHEGWVVCTIRICGYR